MTGIEIGVILGGAALIGGASSYFAKKKVQRIQEGKIFGKNLDVFKSKKLDTDGVLKPVGIWIQLLETQGADTPDIFKRSASHESILSLYDKIVHGSITKKHYPTENIFVIAGILQVFLREMPECIFTNYNDFVELEKTNGDEWRESLQAAIDKLSTPNILLLKRIFEMLHTISQNNQVTNVTAEELAEILCPCLFFSSDPNEAMALCDDMKYLNSLVTKIIKQPDLVNYNRLPSKATPKKNLFSSSKRVKS
eukprot:TRINITY_DN3793_c0_g1_i1.p1 TRINITY_DN3793_c0_g1~~TRINITY_DN3793_c0_g1_i1.p1  ORF type:complete len:275 (-),score=37.66 TRINITY_DN3793_c0_g1_i1:100-855(-)